MFHLNGVKICPTLEEFSAIMGEPKVSTLILPTIGRDLLALVQAPLGVSLNTVVDTIFCSSSICMLDPKIIKIITFFHGTTETSRSKQHNPFRYRSTQSAILGQINPNAPGQS